MGLFKILDKTREVTYQLALPSALSGMHNVFHVSMLRKYISDPSHMMEYELLHLQEDLT